MESVGFAQGLLRIVRVDNAPIQPELDSVFLLQFILSEQHQSIVINYVPILSPIPQNSAHRASSSMIL